MKQQRGAEAEYDVVYPAGAGHTRAPVDRFPLSLVTVPGAALYRAVSRRFRDSGLKARRAGWEGVAVISVGNIEVGGTGKTPFAAWLLERLGERGQRPVYVSRGFKSEAERMRPVSVVAPEETGGPTATSGDIRWVRIDHGNLSRAIGDEGAMVAMKCPSTPLLFSRDKRRAVQLAVDLFHPSHVVLDDAFQSWRVHRDVDIVLVDAVAPFGNGRMVPAGTLREPPDALARASLVGMNGCRGGDGLDAFADNVRRLTGREIPVFGLARGVKLVDPLSGDVCETVDSPVASLSSVARPEGFDAALIERGLELALSVRFPDHHRYTTNDLHYVRRAVRERGCRGVITTEKDWAKLCAMELPLERLFVARLELSTIGMDVEAHVERPRTVSAASS
jgi:tetraacyldisaccharide 4'-kinase